MSNIVSDIIVYIPDVSCSRAVMALLLPPHVRYRYLIFIVCRELPFPVNYIHFIAPGTTIHFIVKSKKVNGSVKVMGGKVNGSCERLLFLMKNRRINTSFQRMRQL